MDYEFKNEIHELHESLDRLNSQMTAVVLMMVNSIPKDMVDWRLPANLTFRGVFDIDNVMEYLKVAHIESSNYIYSSDKLEPHSLGKHSLDMLFGHVVLATEEFQYYAFRIIKRWQFIENNLKTGLNYITYGGNDFMNKPAKKLDSYIWIKKIIHAYRNHIQELLATGCTETVAKWELDELLS